MNDTIKFIRLTLSQKKTPIIISLNHIVHMTPRYENGHGTVLTVTAGNTTAGGFKNERFEVVESLDDIVGWLRVKNK